MIKGRSMPAALYPSTGLTRPLVPLGEAPTYLGYPRNTGVAGIWHLVQL